MPKPIAELSYSELLDVVERRPMWAVDKILKLDAQVTRIDNEGSEVIKLCWKVLDILTPKDPDPDKNSQQVEDFMADHAEG